MLGSGILRGGGKEGLFILYSILSFFINLLYPRRCPVCGEIVFPEKDLIHPSCISKLSPVKSPSCKKCGKEVIGEQSEYCFDCSRHPHAFECGMALLNYNEAAKGSMAAIKYKNRREYLDFYASALDYRFRKIVLRLHADVLVPVPIHSSRRRKRGFNQAEELADRLSKRWNIPVDKRLLVRKKKTAPQRELNPAERLKNLREAFTADLEYGKSVGIPETVILIDDIYTTGSTAEACTRALMQAGVKKVYVVVICIGVGR